MTALDTTTINEVVSQSKIAFLLIKLIGVVIITIMLQILFMRVVTIYRSRQKQKFINQWRPIILETTLELPANLPTLKKKTEATF